MEHVVRSTPPPRSPGTARKAHVVAVVAAALLLSSCGGDDPGTNEEPTPSVSGSPSGSATPTPSTSPSGQAPTGKPKKGKPATPEVVGTAAEGLAVPWGITFLPDGSAVVTERDSARVLHLQETGDGWRTREVGTVAEADPAVEGGLLGVAASPEFDTDATLYFYVTAADDNRIMRARLEDDRLGDLEAVLTGIPKGQIHDGGRLAFGPDGHLYAATGETGVPDLAQDRDSLAGKILRITPDGDPAPGNPDPDSPVWSWGHRNVQGLAWDDQDRLWASEFGASTWDELNLIEKGGNYGWPIIEGLAADNPGVPADGLVDPVVTWRTSEASPSGLAYHDGSLWLGALRGTRLWQVMLDGDRNPRALAHFVGEYGRLRSVAAAPDGTLWVTTSNRDGRGTPAEADDRIFRVAP